MVAVGSVPAVPAVSSVPSVPSLPSIGALPALPAVPSVPSIGTFPASCDFSVNDVQQQIIAERQQQPTMSANSTSSVAMDVDQQADDNNMDTDLGLGDNTINITSIINLVKSNNKQIDEVKEKNDEAPSDCNLREPHSIPNDEIDTIKKLRLFRLVFIRCKDHF